MQTINVNGFIINLNFETQIAKSGRPFRLSGIQLVLNKPAEFVNKIRMHGTIYSFRYLDKDEFFALEFCPKGNFLNKVY